MINDKQERKKILLVDDIEIHLITADLFLRKEYEICKTSSGKEALDCLCDKKFIPDLILLDIMMPDMSGWEVLRKMKTIEYLKNIPVAFLTSSDDAVDKKRAHKMGVVEYITKPYNMVEIQGKVKAILNNEPHKTHEGQPGRPVHVHRKGGRPSPRNRR